jgi:hypothetical protein
MKNGVGTKKKNLSKFEDSIRDSGPDNHGHGGKSGLNPGEFF